MSQRHAMVERQLERRGIRSPRVLEAMRSVPRERFLPPSVRSRAYEDRAVALAHGQTVSQPYIVAAMTEALEAHPEDRILEVGTGSGYQTAILSELAAQVYTIERVGALADRARRTLDELGVDNVRYRVGDGTRGWPEEAPFDGILVTAAAPSVPESLTGQLSPDGGRMVIPVGTRTYQELELLIRRDEDLSSRRLMGCRFVPLLGDEGWGPVPSA